MFKTDPANEVEGEMTVVKEDTISQLVYLNSDDEMTEHCYSSTPRKAISTDKVEIGLLGAVECVHFGGPSTAHVLEEA